MAFSYILLMCFIFVMFDSIRGHIHVVKNGVELFYEAEMSIPSFTDVQRFEILFGGEIEDCVIECGMRNYCKHLTYNVNMHVCELFNCGPEGMIENIVSKTALIHVNRENINITKSPCGQCPNKKACDWKSVHPECVYKECIEFPSITNGSVMGNLHRIGSKIRFKCNPGWKPDRSISSVCLANGTWDATVTCVKWTPLGEECWNESCSDSNATCSSDNICQCKDAFFKHGTVCSKKAKLDEACTKSSNVSCLDENAECSVDGTSSTVYKCKCKHPYFKNGQSCEEKASLGDKCTFVRDSCSDDNARCTGTAKELTCKCRDRYYQAVGGNCVEKKQVGQPCPNDETQEPCLDTNARCEGNGADYKCYCKFQYEYNEVSKKCEKYCNTYSTDSDDFDFKISEAGITDIKFEKEGEQDTFEHCVLFCNQYQEYLSINFYDNYHCVCNKLSIHQYNRTKEEMKKVKCTVYERPCIKPLWNLNNS